MELVGPPGAGKSTVFDALRGADADVTGRPIISRGRHAPWLYANAARLLGSLGRRRALDRGWYPNQLAMAAELTALPRVLARAPAERVIVFDQGPLFTLTRPSLLDGRLQDWWEARFAQWCSLMDAFVWLDAPDAALVERIRTRAKSHRIKEADTAAAQAWLANDRTLLGEVLDRAERRPGGPAVLRFDTSRVAPEAVAGDVLTAVRGR